MKRVLCAFGTRPEAIKMIPVVRALKERAAEFRTRVLVTAQHRDMLDQVMGLFKTHAHYDLGLMRDNQTLNDVTVLGLRKLEPVLAQEKPDLVLVHGDTTTTFITSLAAYYQKIPVAHVEAGLRSGDLYNPFPEEMNRRVTDALTALYFAPTTGSRRHLLNEGVSKDKIFVTGNTVVDALKTAVRLMKDRTMSPPRAEIQSLAENPFVLITAHRRESFGAPMEQVCRALREVARWLPTMHFVFPVHPNPNVGAAVRPILGKEPNVHLLPPLGYNEFVYLMEKCRFMVTDSGGLQEEAPALGKPVLVLRDVTERPEAVKAGCARVIGTEMNAVASWIKKLLTDGRLYGKMAGAGNPFGDGRASERIVEAIRFHFGLRQTRPAEFNPEKP